MATAKCDYDLAQDLYESGLSIEAVAARFGMSVITLKQGFWERGIKVRRKSKLNELDSATLEILKNIVLLREQMKTDKALARELSMTVPELRAHLTRIRYNLIDRTTACSITPPSVSRPRTA